MAVYGHSPLPLAICDLPKILLPWHPVLCRGRWHDDNIKAADVLCDDGSLPNICGVFSPPPPFAAGVSAGETNTFEWTAYLAQSSSLDIP